jgi:GNAT superfamily N-acetyltransferase
MPASRLKIRHATTEDAALITEIGARMFEETFGPDNKAEDMQSYLAKNFTLDKIKSELADPGSTFLLAYEDEEPIGYAELEASEAPESVSGPEPVELVRIYVDQKMIGKGYGSALMKSCIGQAIHDGYKTIWLGVWEKNEHAIRFYEKLGFTIVGPRVFVLGSDIQNDFIMARAVDT